jgi:hypothetical protein
LQRQPRERQQRDQIERLHDPAHQLDLGLEALELGVGGRAGAPPELADRRDRGGQKALGQARDRQARAEPEQQVDQDRQAEDPGDPVDDLEAGAERLDHTRNVWIILARRRSHVQPF